MKPIDRALAELRQLRDQIRLKLRLGGMEARQRWEELEPKLEELENLFERGGGRAAAVMSILSEELGGAYRRFRDRLENLEDEAPEQEATEQDEEQEAEEQEAEEQEAEEQEAEEQEAESERRDQTR